MRKVCEWDQKAFDTIRSDAKYCSDKCRIAASRNDIKIPKKDVYKLSHITIYDRDKNLAAFKKMGMDEVQWITTGIPEFDALTQIPRGRITQIQGPYAVGKTTLCVNMIKGLKGFKVLYIDSEATLNPQLLVDLEVEARNFTLYNESAFIEDIYETIIAAVEHARYDMIILDSLAATTFRTEAANAAADSNIGQKAKIVNKLMRIIPMELKRTNTALVVINQEREVIGSYAPIKYTPGGMGVPYGASLMVALKTTKGARFPKSGPPYRGHEVTAEIIKSKVNDPWRKATFKLYYGSNYEKENSTNSSNQETSNVPSGSTGDANGDRQPEPVHATSD